MTKTILVTGGCGFIGSNFVRYWLTNHPEDTIINFDALTYAGNPANLTDLADHPSYHFVKGDIRDHQSVLKATEGIDLIVHFAAESHVDRSILEPDVFLQTNVLGTFNLLDAAVKNKVPHFHHVSTDEVFGSLELGSAEKFTLATPYAPHSPYSASKASSDHLVRSYGDTFGLNYTITNCSNNYGPYQFPEKLFGLAITNVLEGKKIPLYGDGLNVRDWLYVEDHVRAIEAVLLSGKTKQTFLVGGMEQEVSNREVLEIIAREMDVDPTTQIELVNDRPGHDRRYSIDWSVTEKELGWRPQMSLEAGIKATIEWYHQHPQWWQPLKQQAQDFLSKIISNS